MDKLKLFLKGQNIKYLYNRQIIQRQFNKIYVSYITRKNR